MKEKVGEIAKILGKSTRTVYDWQKNEKKAYIIQILNKILEQAGSIENISNIQFFKHRDQKSKKKDYVKSIQKLLKISPRNYQSWKSVYPNLMATIWTVFRHEDDVEYFLTHGDFENINDFKNESILDKQLIGESILFRYEDLKINDTKIYNTIEKRLNSGNFENLKLLDTNSTILIDNQESIILYYNKTDSYNISLIQTLKSLQLDRDNNYHSLVNNAIKNNNIAEFKFLIGLLSQKIYHSFFGIDMMIIDRIDLLNFLIKQETEIFIKHAKASNEKDMKLIEQQQMRKIYKSLIDYSMMERLAIKFKSI